MRSMDFRGGRRAAWAVVALLSLGACGEDAGDSPRYRPPALDLEWIAGLPAALGDGPVRARYLVHAPLSATDSSPFAEIAFATTDSGYGMAAMEIGVAGQPTEQWLRFGIVQDVGESPLGERYLVDGHGVDRVRVHGRLGGVWYEGESGDVELSTDLSTGAIKGEFTVTLGSPEGPTHGITARFSGQLDRGCTSWIYHRDLDIHTDAATGGPCQPVLDTIDRQPARSDGPELPPGFALAGATAAE